MFDFAPVGLDVAVAHAHPRENSENGGTPAAAAQSGQRPAASVARSASGKVASSPAVDSVVPG